jgi:membrane dipeptidase
MHLHTFTPSSAEELSRALGVSLEAAELVRAADFIDLHLDSFIPPRIFGYDLAKRHGRGLLGGRFFGHLDFPRVLEAGLTGAMWSVTTNPFRSAASRLEVFEANRARLREAIAQSGDRFRVVRAHAEYVRARRDGAHACLLAIQGGNALEAAADPTSVLGDDVTRVTIVHLTSSVYGATSSPFWRLGGGQRLSREGHELIHALDAARVFVDLAHIHPRAFWDAVEAHDPSLPLVATHTGVAGVCPHWRNLDDRQIRAIADSGGVVGVIFAEQFLAPRGTPRARRDAGLVVDHLAHLIDVGGEDCAAIGSDYDGAIVPPRDLRDGVAYVRVVQRMLDRGFSSARVRKILGGNFLRAFAALRP